MSALAYSFSNLTGTLTGSAGDVTGIDLRGTVPGQSRVLTGATALASITGYNTGSAGAGTSTTSLAKPSGGSNWVADALVGKWVKVGTELRRINSNTTTTAAFNAITGLTSGSSFQIVDLTSMLDQISVSDLVALRVASCLGSVEIIGFDFSDTHTLDALVEVRDCFDVKFTSCRFAQNTASPAFSATRCFRLQFDHCEISNSADLEITDCQFVSSVGCVNDGGGVVDMERAFSVDIRTFSAVDAPSRALSIVNAFSVALEADCNDCGASPIYMSGVDHMVAVGGLLTGSGNTGYGLEVAHSGRYVITGSTITGLTNDVLFNSTAADYGPSGYLGINYGAMATATLGLVAQVSPTKTAFFGNILFDGSLDKSAREISYGVRNPSNVTIAGAGTNVSNATQIVQQEFVVVSSCASGAGVKLHNVSVLPGVPLEIYNGAANACLVYPSNGGTINGGASVSVAVGKVAMFRCVDWAADKWIANVAVLG